MSNSPFDGGPISTSGDLGSIEFVCQTCGRQLRVPVQYAGRKAKCPECGAIQTIALPQPAPPQPAPPQPAPPPVAAPVPAASQVAAPPQSPFDEWFGGASRPAADRPSVTPPASASGPGPAAPPVPADVAATPVPFAASSPFASPVSPTGTAPVPHPAPPAGSPMLPTAPAPAPRPQFSTMHHPGKETETKQLFDRITAEIGKIYVGQQELVLGALVALFSSGHVLIESVPGLGKTLFVRTLGRVLGCQFGRIQFTADLMPSDITGAPIFDMKTQEFRFRPGPVFTQFLLADEINRSPAKTHAALLEIMQEYRVTIDGKSHNLKRPFLVLATQNPIESEGTYNLPEAQLDRFTFKLTADYPRAEEEAEILDLHSRQVDLNERLERELTPLTTPEDIVRITRQNAEIRVDPKLIDYINKVVRLTRKWPQFHLGASPRAGIALVQSARTLAAFAGRDYAVPDDVVQLALPALRHRVILTAEAEVEGRNVDELLTELIRSVEVPRL
jgi:MoxR-like ATPase